MKLPASWKTLVVGIASLLLATIQGCHEPSIAAAIHDPAFQMAVLVGVLGILAKDFNVTGGDVGQPSSMKALEEASQAPSATNPPKP